MDYTKTVDEQRYDLERSLYYESFLNELLKAIHIDGANVVAAFAWGIMDDNEFGNTNTHFGVQTVDRESQTLERKFKRSIFDFVDFFKGHIVS